MICLHHKTTSWVWRLKTPRLCF